MGVFITTTEALSPRSAHRPAVVSEKELERHIAAIRKAHRKLVEEIESERREYGGLPMDDCGIHDTKRFEHLFKLMKRALEAATKYNATAQFTILQLVLHVLIYEDVEGDRMRSGYGLDLSAAIIRDFGWDIIRLLEPYLVTANGDDSMCREVRRLAALMFGRIGRRINYKEVYVIVSEQMSVLDWESCYPNEEECVRAALKIIEYIKIYGTSLELLSDPKPLVSYMSYPAKFMSRTIDFLGKVVLERASWGNPERDPNRWDKLVFVLGNALLDFVEFGHNSHMVGYKNPFLRQNQNQKPESSDIGQESDEVKRWYLSTYLLILFLEKVVLNLHMDLVALYTHLIPWKFDVKKPPHKFNATLVMYTPEARSKMLDLVFRCTRIAKALGVTFDGMLRLKRSLDENSPVPTPKEARSEDQDEEEERNRREKINHKMFPLSYDGIATLLAISIYDAYLFGPSFEARSLNIMPLILDPKWIGRECLGMILNLLSVPHRVPRVDKGLMILIYLACNVETRVDAQVLQAKLPGPVMNHSQFPLVEGLQVMCATACGCPDPDLRLIACRLIANFINMCEVDAQIFVFLELLDRPPFPAMRTASVGLLKDQVDASFNAVIRDRVKDPRATFSSRMITDKFFPLMFKKPTEDNFWADYSFAMQVLNFYLYLLMRDKHNLTNVWDEDVRDWVTRQYIMPLENLVNESEQKCREKIKLHDHPHNHMDDEESPENQLARLNLLRDAIGRVKEQKAPK